MNVAQIIDRFKNDRAFTRNLTAWRTVPERPPRYAEFPEKLAPKLVEAMRKRGIENLLKSMPPGRAHTDLVRLLRNITEVESTLKEGLIAEL